MEKRPVFLVPIKEIFRWSLRKKGKQLLNTCRHLTLFCGFMTLLASGQALANPEGGVVTSGSASIVNTPTELQINQTSDRALIEWSSFDIDQGETTRFSQPNSNSVALNRVTNSAHLSTINGNLIANGRVVIINPNGVLIGENGNVDTAGFIATTADIDDQVFMNGGILNFDKAGSPDASVENRGTISVAEEGLAALVAPTVRNRGLIQGRLAKVQLAAADTFAVDFYGDGLISFAVGASPDGQKRTLTAENTGAIIADGGQVLMTTASASNVVDSVINNEGVIKAASLENRGGKIVLSAAGAQVKVSGKLDVSGEGHADGGTIHVGGDFQGKGPLEKAATADITEAATLLANGGNTGDGGNIIVWSEARTTSRGRYTAKGGTLGGNGGLVETSSKDILDVDGSYVDTLAAYGLVGNWLLDPANIVIAAAGVPYTPLPPAGTSTVGVTSINNAASNVVLSATSDITFSANINMVNSGVSLTANAGRDITVGNNSIVMKNGNLTFNATRDIRLNNSAVDTNGGAVSLNTATRDIQLNNSSIVSNGGSVTLNSDNNLTLNGTPIDTDGGNVTLNADNDMSLTGAATFITSDGGDVSIQSGDNINSNGARIGTSGGDVNISSITSSFLNTTINTTGGSVAGDIDVLDSADANITSSELGNGNSYSQGNFGGDINIQATNVQNSNNNCFKAGGAGSCAAVADPFSIVSLTVTINDFTKNYGQADPLFTWALTSGALSGGDTLSVVLARTLGQLVGNYSIFQTSYLVTNPANYNITFLPGNLQIIPANLVLQAVNQNKTYGDDFTFNGTEYTINTGSLFFADNITGVTLTSAGAPEAASVGGYDILASNVAGSGLSNYNISYLPGTMTVTQARLLLTALDQSKIYGDLFTFSGTEFTVSGLKNADTVDLVTLTSFGAPVTANVGTYEVNGSNAIGTGIGNYNIVYNSGEMTVTPAPLTVTALDQTKDFGTNFVFTGTEFSSSGLKNADTVLSVALDSLGAPAPALSGDYPILASNALGLGLGNYTISYLPGTLTVNLPPNSPFATFAALGRPVISVADQALVFDGAFEQFDILGVATDVGIAANNNFQGSSVQALADISPAAGGNSSPKKGPMSIEDLANVEPAAGGPEPRRNRPAKRSDRPSRDIVCGNSFLDNKPCAADHI